MGYSIGDFLEFGMAAVYAWRAIAMTYYEDLSPCDYFGQSWSHLVAIGWLESNREYVRGEVSTEFFKSLIELLVNPWQPVVASGVQRCNFCRFSGGPGKLQFGGITVRIGVANLFVPEEHQVFVAPSLIAHYIDSHEYAPPNKFQQAVLACSRIASADYVRMLRKHGLHKLGSNHPP